MVDSFFFVVVLYGCVNACARVFFLCFYVLVLYTDCRVCLVHFCLVSVLY